MIYFLVPDDPHPFGGIRMIYEYVSILDRAGHPAAVWHGTAGFRCTWFPTDARVVNAMELSLAPGDLLVVPETQLEHWSILCAGVPKVVLNQNHFNTFADIGSDGVDACDYPGSPEVVAAIATSRAIYSFLRAVTPDSFPVYRVPIVLDLDTFAPRAKECLITWMPRKRARQTDMVVRALRRRGNLSDWTFQPLDGLTAEETASALGRTSIFLLGGSEEGFGLPGVEAMAAGARVIGFPGGGGLEYTKAPLCTAMEDGDVLAMVHAVEEAARNDANGRDGWEEQIVTTREWLGQHYGLDRVASQLVRAAEELTRDGSDALVKGPTIVRHLEVQARRERSRQRLHRRLVRRGLRAVGLQG